MAGKPDAPGFGTMFDAVDLMRRTWSGMNLPSSLQPTMDLSEIDRRIADLKVVEQWLNLNLGMLHTTIQTLEIQRNTLATMQAFGQAAGGGAEAAARAAAAAFSPSPSASSPAPAAGRSSSARPASAPAPAAAAPAPVPPTGTVPPAAGAAPGPAETAALNAALWWEMLQQPFRQMAAAAAASAPGAQPKSDDGAPADGASSGTAAAPARARAARPTSPAPSTGRGTRRG